MARVLGGLLGFCAGLSALAGQPVAAGWDLEQGVPAPSYAFTEPESTDLNIDIVALSCEQGPQRRGLQLRLYLSRLGPLAPKGAVTLKDEPRVELAIDGARHGADLLFADDSVLVADAADGAVPFLSDALLDKLQAGRRLELRFDLVQELRGQAPSFDSTVVVDLQAGSGGQAIAAVRRCIGGPMQHLAESPRPAR
jgi:hypothetical protein